MRYAICLILVVLCASAAQAQQITGSPQSIQAVLRAAITERAEARDQLNKASSIEESDKLSDKIAVLNQQVREYERTLDLPLSEPISSSPSKDQIASFKPSNSAIAKPQIDPDSAPICRSTRQCEAMWIQAQETIQMLSRMRLRVVTGDRLETFTATTFGRMTGVVSKVPVQGGYELRAELHCYGIVGCADLENKGVRVFNNMIAGTPDPDAGMQATAPAPPPAVIPTPAPQPSAADELSKLADLKARGVLTQAEFNVEKAKILSRK